MDKFTSTLIPVPKQVISDSAALPEFNQVAFLDRELARALRCRRPLSLAMFDLERFNRTQTVVFSGSILHKRKLSDYHKRQCISAPVRRCYQGEEDGRPAQR